LFYTNLMFKFLNMIIFILKGMDVKINIIKFIVLFLWILFFNIDIIYSQVQVDTIIVKPDSINLTAPVSDSFRIYISNTIIHSDSVTPQGNVVAGDTISFIILFYDVSFFNIHFTAGNLDSVGTNNKRNGLFLTPSIDSVYIQPNGIGRNVAVGVFPYRTDPTPGLTDTVWFIFKDTNGSSYSSEPTIFTTIDKPIYITIPEILALQGETFDIPIKMEGGYSVDDSILSFKFGVKYDMAILTFNNASLTPLTLDFSIEENLIVDTICVSCAYHYPVSSIGDLVYLNFTVNNGTVYGDSSVLHITKSLLNKGKPYSIDKDGKVDIKPLFGDANRNGAIEALDATKILEYRVNLAVIDSVDSIHCDVSGNNAVTSFDAGLVLQWISTPVDLRRFPVEDLLGLKPSLMNRNAEILVYSEQDLKEENINTSDNYKIISVDLKNIDEVFSLDMVFDYDYEFFEFVDYRIPDLTNRFSTIVNDLHGKILVAMVGSRPIKSDGKVIEFVFRKNDEGNGEYYFTSFMINEREMNSKIEYVSTPSSYILYQNYPNPFNLETEVKFIIPEPCDVLLKIYNLLGEEIRTLVNERREKGYYTVKWDGKDSRGLTTASGVYFYRLKAGSFVSTKKMILIK